MRVADLSIVHKNVNSCEEDAKSHVALHISIFDHHSIPLSQECLKTRHMLFCNFHYSILKSSDNHTSTCWFAHFWFRNIIHILRHCGPQRDVEDSQARAHVEKEGSSGGDQPWHQQAWQGSRWLSSSLSSSSPSPLSSLPSEIFQRAFSPIQLIPGIP